jgi:hypothetical protein
LDSFLSLDRATLILLFAAASYTVAHGARLLMRGQGPLKWTAGVVFGFAAFLVSRIALAGAAWLVFTVLFGQPPGFLILLALVGHASSPLLLSFVNATPFFGPGVLRLLYVISLIRLTSLTSLALGMDWLGCLGWWVAAWLLASVASYALTRSLRNVKWLSWTGILGPFRPTPADIMAKMPGMQGARRT